MRAVKGGWSSVFGYLGLDSDDQPELCRAVSGPLLRAG